MIWQVVGLSSMIVGFGIGWYLTRNMGKKKPSETPKPTLYEAFGNRAPTTDEFKKWLDS